MLSLLDFLTEVKLVGQTADLPARRLPDEQAECGLGESRPATRIVLLRVEQARNQPESLVS